MTRWAASSLALLALLATGCHTFRFDLSRTGYDPQPIVDRKTFWVFAWFPTQDVDMRTICPSGVAAIEEQVTFTDGLFTLLTLNIYSPRTSYYYCKLPAPPVPPASRGGP